MTDWKGKASISSRRRSTLRRSIVAVLGGALIASWLVPAFLQGAVVPKAAAQQDVMRIAAVVNDDVVSIFDLAVRLQVAIRSSGFNDTQQLRRQLAPQVLRAIVDERLQAQEGARFGLSASPEDIAGAIGQIEAQNNWEAGSFDRRVAAAGLDRGAVVDQIRTSIIWGKVIRRRFASIIAVSEEEIDGAIERIEANRGKPESRVAEIFLPIDDPDQERVTRSTIEDLERQLRAGASFPAVARQFSEGATAQQGGEIGWVIPGQLAPEVDQAVANLSPGQISRPIRTFDGYYIVTVLQRRTSGASGPVEPSFELAQVVLDPALDDNLSSETLIAELRQAGDCASFLATASGRAGPRSGGLGTIALSDLPPDLRAAIEPLQAGQVSAALPFEDTRRLLMVCDRTQPEATPTAIDRDAIRRDLSDRKLDLAARRHLRDLRRAAYIEIRI